MSEKSSSSVEETHNGVRKKGDLDDIKDFAEEVEDAMEESDLSEDSVEEFGDWRPRGDETEQEIKEKTVEAARTKKTGLERKSNGTKKDVEKGSERIAEAGRKITNGERPESEIKDASKDFARPFFSGAAKTFRKVEETVYSKLMLPLNGYYFDSDDLAADIRKKNGEYRMDVKTTEEEKRDVLKDEISDREA